MGLNFESELKHVTARKSIIMCGNENQKPIPFPLPLQLWLRSQKEILCLYLYTLDTSFRFQAPFPPYNLMKRMILLLLYHHHHHYYYFFFFRDRVSLYSPVCPGTYFVDQAGLDLRNPPAFTS